MERATGHLHFHYPCFDGLVSAAIAWDVREHTTGWTPSALEPLNYDVRDGWEARALAPDSVVVDFLFHPDAAFWADHHGTTFVTDDLRARYEAHEASGFRLYDPRYPSCAKLLWDNVGQRSSDRPRFAEMAYWANRTDSADYASVEEALFGESPAFEIARSLALDEPGYGEYLLRHLRTQPLAAVAELVQVREKAAEVRRRTQLGIDALAGKVHEHHHIAVVDAEQRGDAIINRYSPYHFAPDVRYSVALIRTDNDAKITAMRNPWRDFESVPLGQIFRDFRGGGHQRVASVVLPGANHAAARDTLDAIVGRIVAADEAGYGQAI